MFFFCVSEVINFKKRFRKYIFENKLHHFLDSLQDGKISFQKYTSGIAYFKLKI